MQTENHEVLKGNEGKVTKEGNGQRRVLDQGRIKEVTTETGSADNQGT